ncbi:AAA family ATPase [Candidatus Marithrix sp. Canyon 246]|uniref:AAA family ATPase n=1 Tax=Candidatus Marithrix sp. Canyon 246 TaxID=1827136 RepID=UPI00084A0592|nr:ATP-binding protein [Candidatus Marithrix sp. Canyon 246]
MNYIKKVKIDKLFDELDINWNLDPKVNILIGKNGSGKSTLLSLIKNFFRSEAQSLAHLDVNSIDIEIENDDVEQINLCYINTFEMYLENLQQLSENSQAKNDLKTELDVILEHLINDWKNYLLKRKNLAETVTIAFDQKIREISSKETGNEHDFQELKKLLNEKTKQINDIYYYRDNFIEQINHLFSDSNKRIDFDENNAIIFKNNNNKSLSVYELSSGEKQILIILLNVLIQENKPTVILMDEPEVSLHLAWQLDLIDMIQNLNQNCQIIIVTHSAGVFNKGWKDKITKIENITSQSESHD